MRSWECLRLCFAVGNLEGCRPRSTDANSVRSGQFHKRAQSLITALVGSLDGKGAVVALGLGGEFDVRSSATMLESSDRLALAFGTAPFCHRKVCQCRALSRSELVLKCAYEIRGSCSDGRPQMKNLSNHSQGAQ